MRNDSRESDDEGTGCLPVILSILIVCICAALTSVAFGLIWSNLLVGGFIGGWAYIFFAHKVNVHEGAISPIDAVLIGIMAFVNALFALAVSGAIEGLKYLVAHYWH